jgi:predicted nucleic acid-binding protein
LSVVLDASALVVLALDRRRASAVEARLREWDEAGEALHAPELLRYEAANALARAAAAGQLPASPQRLERKSAYDAAYLVLADRLGAELWTLDGPLARSAGSRGLSVRLIEA